MIWKIIKMITGTGKTLKSTVDKSTDFMDNLIENEPISSTIDKVKNATGGIIEKAGEAYQNVQYKAEEMAKSDALKPYTDKAKGIITDIKENENVKNMSEKIKHTASDMAEKAEDFMEDLENKLEVKLFGEEE